MIIQLEYYFIIKQSIYNKSIMMGIYKIFMHIQKSSWDTQNKENIKYIDNDNTLFHDLVFYY